MINRINPLVGNKSEEVTFEKEIKQSIDFARKVYEDKDSFAPMAIGITDKGRYIVPCFWKDDESKYRMVDGIKKAFKDFGVTVIVFMTESWMLRVRHPALYNPNVRPSKHPDRIEILMISYVDKSGTRGVIIPIERDDKNKVELGEPKFNEIEGCQIVDNLFGDYFSKEVKGGTVS